MASISRCNSKESQNKFSLGYHKIVIHQGTTRFFIVGSLGAANISKVCSQKFVEVYRTHAEQCKRRALFDQKNSNWS